LLSQKLVKEFSVVLTAAKGRRIVSIGLLWPPCFGRPC